MKQLDGKEKELKFILNHIHLSEFREKAIEYLLEIQDFSKALELCEEGIVADRQYRGLVHKWKEYELKVYECLGDKGKQKELLLQFLFNNEFTYYSRLKQMYTDEEWPEIFTYN